MLHGAGICTSTFAPNLSPSLVGFYVPAPWHIWVCDQPYPVVISSMACWKIPHWVRWLYHSFMILEGHGHGLNVTSQPIWPAIIRMCDICGPQSFRCTWPSSFSAFGWCALIFSIKKPLFPVDIGDIFDENYQVAFQFSKICVPRAPRRALRFLTPSPWRKRVHVAESTTFQAFNHHSPVGILEYRKKLLVHILQCLLIICV